MSRRKQIDHVTEGGSNEDDENEIAVEERDEGSPFESLGDKESPRKKREKVRAYKKVKLDARLPPELEMDEDDPARVCSVCDERFIDVDEFERHLLQHNLYLCPSCERCFKYKRSYQNHRFLCEDGISKVIKPKINSTRKVVQINGIKKQSQDSKDASLSTCNKKKNREDRNDAVEPKVADTTKDSSDIKTEPDAEVTKRETCPKMSDNRLPAKKRKPVTVEIEDQTEPANDAARFPADQISHDCDLRTLALAAASVSPHSKATIESVAETDSTSNRSSLSSPFKLKEKFHQAFSSPDAETRSTFTPQFMLPSAFIPPNGNPREPAFTWQGIEIQSETAMVARLDGFNPTTEQHYVLYKCCICSNAFPNLTLLVSHLGIHGRGSKEHGCDKCGAVFKWRSQLEVHEQVHMVMDNMALSRAGSLLSPNRSLDEEKPRDFSKAKNNFGYPSLPTSPFFPVFPTTNYSPNGSESDVTNKIADNHTHSSPDAFVDSVNKLNRIPSFQCNYCTKRFDRLFSMQRHERIHTGIKPCFCKQCGRGFSERRNLRHHVIRFHSDVTQREPSRRGKKSKSRSSNPSHKLVSFLKKTAVRILNTMEQSKYGVPDPFETVLEKPMESGDGMIHEESQEAPLSLMVPKHLGDNHQEEAETYMEVEIDPETVVTGNDKSNDKMDEEVTVVIPTEVSGRESDSSLPDQNQREVLQDPKRSLIGSRRKGRPFRYAPSQSSQNGSVNEEDLNTNSGSAVTNPTPPLTIVKEEIDPGLDDNSNFCCQFPFNLPGKENSEESLRKYGFPGETSTQFKARLRGHGTFFSNYNPRLGVVNSPVIRSEACRPQIGPDGKYVYPCSYCFKTFCSTSDLNRHMDFHEDVRPFKCPYCNYYSRTNSQLKVHTMRHEGIKQFLCSLCNYNGVTQSDLNRHCKTRTHVLRARNCCLTCGVGFYTRTLLEEHLRLVNHCALDYGLIKKERDDSDLAEVREISDSEQLGDNSNSNETNNNDYSFNSKNINLSFGDKRVRTSPVQDIPLYLGQTASTPITA